MGDRVIAFTGFGAFAEQVLVPALSLVAMPEALDFAQAAALIQSYCTMLFTLTRRTRLVAGEWVLVLGAGGGVGLAAVDIATALGGRVIAAASDGEKLAVASAMGAEATIRYEDEDLKARARELSGGGVDLVVDPVGGRHSEPALRALGHLGRFCVIGFASGDIASVPLNQVLLNNRTVVGVDWGGWTFKDPAGNRQLIDELMELVDGGRLHPTHPVTYRLDEAADGDVGPHRPHHRRQGGPRPLTGRRDSGRRHLWGNGARRPACRPGGARARLGEAGWREDRRPGTAGTARRPRLRSRPAGAGRSRGRGWRRSRRGRARSPAGAWPRASAVSDGLFPARPVWYSSQPSWARATSLPGWPDRTDW